MNESIVDMTALQRFQLAYSGIHGYLSSTTCAFGILANLLNILVLSRLRDVSATTFLLTALACSDLLKMLSYLPFAVRFYCQKPSGLPYAQRHVDSYGWVLFLMVSLNVTLAAHTTSIWLSAVLAVYRRIYVRGVRVMVSRRQRILVATLVASLAAIFVYPNYVTLRIKAHDNSENNSQIIRRYRAFENRPVPVTFQQRYGGEQFMTYDNDNNVTGGFLTVPQEDRPTIRQRGSLEDSVHEKRHLLFGEETSTTETADTGRLYKLTLNKDVGPLISVNFWLQALLFKLIPCCIMVVYLIKIVGELRAERARLRRLHRIAPTAPEELNGTGQEEARAAMMFSTPETRERYLRQVQENCRCVAMLLVVITLTVVSEMPNGLLAVVCALDHTLFTTLYMPLGDVMDMLALLNNAVNFVLYCAMRRQFRREFCRLLGSGDEAVHRYLHLRLGRQRQRNTQAMEAVALAAIVPHENGPRCLPGEDEQINHGHCDLTRNTAL